jgi:hypothetical protein
MVCCAASSFREYVVGAGHCWICEAEADAMHLYLQDLRCQLCRLCHIGQFLGGVFGGAE